MTAPGACPFCAIVDGEGPATIVDRWSDAMAIVPLSPVVRGHTLIIPLVHVADAAEDPTITGDVYERAARFAQRFDDFNLITSKGRAATQTVFHFHVHVVPRWAETGPGRKWPWR